MWTAAVTLVIRSDHLLHAQTNGLLKKFSACWWFLLSTKTGDAPSRTDGDGMTAGLYLEINGRGAISSEMIVIKEHSPQVQTRCLQTPVIFILAAGMRCCSSKNGSSIKFLEVIISHTLFCKRCLWFGIKYGYANVSFQRSFWFMHESCVFRISDLLIKKWL